jgi:hypothetical protein
MSATALQKKQDEEAQVKAHDSSKTNHYAKLGAAYAIKPFSPTHNASLASQVPQRSSSSDASRASSAKNSSKAASESLSAPSDKRVTEASINLKISTTESSSARYAQIVFMR